MEKVLFACFYVIKGVKLKWVMLYIYAYILENDE